MWQSRGVTSSLFLPLSWLFRAATSFRRLLFRVGWKHSTRLSVPVIVIGNITVGGTGKTPLVIALVKALVKAGFHPGVLSRGYRGSGTTEGSAIEVEQADVARFGDEIVLIKEHTGVPAAVGRRRAAAGEFLLGRHPEIDVLVADDGLQHYALARTVEVAVFDARGAGNGRLLPAGPLREPIGRLATVDAVVFNEAPHGAAQLGLALLVPSPPAFRMELTALDATQLVDPSRKVPLSQLQDQTLLAAAGIGAPERFFAMLARAGLRCAQLPLPDHFDYRIDPFRGRSEQMILITEKDAVKCRHLNDARLWVVPVEAILEEKFVSFVLEKLRAWR